MKQKISEHDRSVIVSAANVAIRTAPEASQREEIRASFAALLIQLKAYRGYNFAEWLDGGHAAWTAAGKPENNDSFIGDKTLTRLY